MSDPSDTSTTRAREAFAGLLARLEGDPSFDVERAIDAHGGLAPELRALWARWRRLEHLFVAAGGDEETLAGLETALAGGPRPDDELAASLARILERGRLEDRYELGPRIGRGGMGVVHRARDRDLARDVALKIVRRRAGEEPERTALRLLAEARLAARLDHPGIVPVHDVGVDARGRLFYAMRLVDGVDLGVVLAELRERRGGRTREQALEVLVKVADAVARAHACGIVHRDLKPANVLVGRFGEVSVTDFGLARAIAGPGSAPDGVAGTPAYMAPEQARGEAVDARADVYSIGAMLHELVGGERPYAEHEPRGRAAVIEAVLAGPPADLERLRPRPDAELCAIVAKATARDRAARYATAGELAADLRAWMQGRVVRAHATGARAELSKWVRRNRALATVSAAALVLALGGALLTSLVAARGRAEVLRLADALRLAELERRAEALWPAVPSRVAELDAWIAEAEGLAARRAEHLLALARLDAELGERAPRGGGPASDDAEDRWRRERLSALVDDLARFSDPVGGTIALVRARREHASALEDESLRDHARAWAEAAAAIGDAASSPRYRGLSLAPQPGLVPLGRDPASGLWEFADLSTGVAPSRGPDGALAVSGESAVVLVLIPPGEFVMGSSRPRSLGDARGDPLAAGDEEPAHEERVAAFLLAKHELTRAQWRRLSRGLPWRAEGAEPDDLLPASGFSLEDAVRVLARAGLELPSEPQWEYAARADTATRWSSGNEPSTLAGRANGARPAEPGLPARRPASGPVEVDRLRPNGFGLVHVHGNVAEWTSSAWSPRYGEPPTALRVARGGSHASEARDLRSAAREALSPATRSAEVGVRPARALARAR